MIPKTLILFVVALLQIASACAAERGPVSALLLVAKPGLVDPNFRETVVLVLRVESGSAPLGLVLNRPLDARLSEIIPDAAGVPRQFDSIYRGGPVQPNAVVFLLRNAEQPPHSVEVLDHVFLSGNRELMQSIMRGELEVSAFRAYAGYSGWGPGQLESEIAAGGWNVAEADADLIFAADVSTMWLDLNRRVNGLTAQLTR